MNFNVYFEYAAGRANITIMNIHPDGNRAFSTEIDAFELMAFHHIRMH